MTASPSPLRGKVTLLGAGPGDPGLLTLSGREALERCDVVIYDYLANPRLLEHAPPAAQRLFVGKTAGIHAKEQSEINALLISYAQEGKEVVRLKGGDPFIFGRGGEEALALAQAGIPFEVIPGVSSAHAVPAYAGIPVTHRDFTAGVTFVTGHENPLKPDSSVPWSELARGVDTLVFLMGAKNLLDIANHLMSHGRPPKTPLAIIRWGTTSQQRTLVTTLGEAARDVQRAAFAAPAIMIVGEVVRLREQLNWFENRPLFKKRILVTRPRAQATGFIHRLEGLGAAVHATPLISIEPPAKGYTPLDGALRVMASRQNPYKWLLFTSVNAVEATLARLFSLGFDLRALGGVRIACVGKETVRQLGRYHVKADLTGEGTAGRLLDSLMPELSPGDEVLFPRSQIGRPELKEGLEAAGIAVSAPVAYATRIDRHAGAEMAEQVLAGELDFVTLTSSSCAAAFAESLGERRGDLPAHLRLVCIGPTTAQTLRDGGLAAHAVANPHTTEGLVQRLIALSVTP